MPSGKGAKIDTVTHDPTETTLQIYLNKKEGKFYIHDDDHTIYLDDIDLNALKRRALAALKEQESITWQRLIIVYDRSGDGQAHTQYGYADRVNGVGNAAFAFLEVYIGTLPNGQQRIWGHDRISRDDKFKYHKPFRWDERKNGPFIPPCHSETWHNGTEEHYLPWSQELWDALVSMIAGIRFIRGRIVELLSSDAGLQQLASTAHALLPAPEAPDEPIADH